MYACTSTRRYAYIISNVTHVVILRVKAAYRHSYMHMLNVQVRVLLVDQHGREVAPMTQEGSLYMYRSVYVPTVRYTCVHVVDWMGGNNFFLPVKSVKIPRNDDCR